MILARLEDACSISPKARRYKIEINGLFVFVGDACLLVGSDPDY